MKNITKSIIALFAVFAVACSSDDVEDRPVIEALDGPTLIAPDGGSYVLNIESANNLAERFIWTPANYGQSVAINYEVELDVADGVDEFQAPRSLGSVIGANQLAVSVVTLNTAVIALGGAPLVEGQYVVRVKASVNSTFEAIYSQPVTISITPYQAFVPLQNLYIMGTATEFGFANNAGNTPMFRDAEDQNLFRLRSYFTAGELKLISTLGAWQPQYGAGEGNALAINPGGGTDPNPIVVPADGYYDLEVNLDEMTYSLTSFTYTPATMPTYATVGITGSATPDGWPDNGVQDVTMTNSIFNPHIWKISDIALTVAEAKFRANDAWDVNWGTNSAVSGQATIGGSNIPVTAEGNYDVWFNDLDGRYIFILN